MIAARIETPAKVNLGLEIPGRRADGYHEIVTILCMLDLADELVVFPDPFRSGTPLAGVDQESNLVARALRAFESRSGDDLAYGWRLDKRVPAAAGLGGASANAAGALLAANQIAPCPLPDEDLVAIANSLGSDIAFFLGSPTALATGTGTTLEALPSFAGDVLLIVPPDTLTNKTAAMYGALQPDDFSSGASVRRNASAIQMATPACDVDLTNAFQRALIALVPGAAMIHRALREVCAAPWGVSGAGPAFQILAPRSEHDTLVEQLRATLPEDVVYLSTSARQLPMRPERVAWTPTP